ncbi:hypothetical protein AG1IA_04674 [Rhizoctonia solani AG-1 IA]|uniref:Uncharacterized protein n=1 Tax=Thanatephorus cucumeris (strain AG1-IA) TaxID=983506 RepID=L8WT66_THACA|nr:hypothetical protein AG1IA_04674 [Rhizoctonia solani AG-1 IA]
MARISAPHALLCVEWGQSGCAMLSIPTKEYFQSSPFVPDPRGTHRTAESLSASLWESVRSGTPFYSEFGDRPDVPVAPSASGSGSLGQSTKSKHGHSRSRGTTGEGDDWGKMYPESRSSPAPSSSSSDDERRTITGASWHPSMAGTTSTMGTRQDVIEEAGAGDAFAAGKSTRAVRVKHPLTNLAHLGMIFALSRRLLPGAPYSPGLHHLPGPDAEKGRWRLEECLRWSVAKFGDGGLRAWQGPWRKSVGSKIRWSFISDLDIGRQRWNSHRQVTYQALRELLILTMAQLVQANTARYETRSQR